VPSLTREQGEQLFLEELDTIEGAIRFACSRAGLRDADAEDFASEVKMRLIETDYAVLRTFESRSKFRTFINIVIHRMLLDRRIQQWGKWHSSAEAKRLGPIAVELETLTNRDGRSLQVALAHCRKLDPTLTVETLQELAARLPPRTQRPRPVHLEAVVDELRVAGDTVSEATFDSERRITVDAVGEIIRATLADFSREDQTLFRLHFGAGMKIAEIARAQQIDQKPLYRRLKRCLRELRSRLEASGISADAALDAAEMRASDLDLGLSEETPGSRPSETGSIPGGKRGGSR
jgi:RNA polymerase sigma factor (sigma-70 family)